MIKKVVKVASGIIYSQEGNYGSVNKNDNNHGMSIGKCQWNAYWGRALPLLKSIVEKDQEQAKEILGDALYTEIAGSSADAWNRQERKATEEEAKAISKLLTTKDGKEVQDDLADADITGYVKNGVKIGLVSLKALAYFADLENQGGSGVSSRIAKTAAEATGGAEKVGLEEIHAYALKDATMGQYESRRSKVYEAIKGSNLTDVSHTKTEEKQNTPQKPQETPTGVSKGDIVTFTGGGVYISSTAEYAAKEKDVVSTCKVTAVNEKGTHKYHCISQDGKGVYGWVNAESIKGRSLKIGNDRKLAEYIENKIVDNRFSPEAALAEVARSGIEFKTTISVRTLYRYIDNGIFLKLTNKDLPIKSKKKKHNKKIQVQKRAAAGESIENRPKEIEKREIFGHWEMDTVKGKRGVTKSCMLVLTERKTRDEIVIKLKDQGAASVVDALDRLERKWGDMFYKVFRSITVDNGVEFSDYEGMERSALKEEKRTFVFYCHPYSSWERGTNENNNRLIRRHIPKGVDFEDTTDEEIKYIETWINNYPRGIFDFKTSAELFDEELQKLA